MEGEKYGTIEYDYILYTRPDIYFHKPLQISQYIDVYYNAKELPALPKKHIFTANNLFGRMNVADPRYNCEADLIWFSNFKSEIQYAFQHTDKEKSYFFNNIPVISIDYRFCRDFFLQRIDFKLCYGTDIHSLYEELQGKYNYLRKHYFAYILSRIINSPLRLKKSCQKRYKKWLKKRMNKNLS